MSTLRSLVRPPAESFVRALSPHPERKSIDSARALHQHHDYCAALEEAGVEVVALEPLEAFPDSTFVEDNAVILEGTAYITAMKAQTRQGESAHTQPALAPYLPVEILKPPLFLDGGDVIATPEAIFIGQSDRTGEEAVQYFKDKLNVPVIPVEVTNALHLKTAASWLGGNQLLVSPEGCDTTAFMGFKCNEVRPEDAYAANCLVIGNRVILPAGFERVEEMLQAIGLTPRPVDMSEFEKADGGITCLSLIISN
jgi:dimethylargininase